MWESNPPKRPQAPRAGFEDQRAHQNPSTPICLWWLLLDYLSIQVLTSQAYSCLISKFSISYAGIGL